MSEYENIRSEPKICEVIRHINERRLDVGKYPYVEKPVETGKKVNSKVKRGANEESKLERQDVIDNPRIFVFMIGGLSHHEIVSIANL